MGFGLWCGTPSSLWKRHSRQTQQRRQRHMDFAGKETRGPLPETACLAEMKLAVAGGR